MKILARGEKIRTEELTQKLSALPIEWTIVDDQGFGNTNIQDFDVIFDLNFDEHQSVLKNYAPLKNKVVIVSATKKSLAQAAHEYPNAVDCVLVGLNALPIFINKNLAEISMLRPDEEATVKTLFSQLQWEYKLVNDRVGFVTPRITAFKPGQSPPEVRMPIRFFAVWVVIFETLNRFLMFFCLS